MKGQSEIIVFILLFLIGFILFSSSVLWSRGIFQRNVDIGKINAAENFMKNLDEKIKNIISFGGSESIDYTLDSNIELLNENTIEIKLPVTIDLPRKWVNISSDVSIIREILEENILRIQLTYPEKDFAVEFFTEGPTLAKPDKIKIEKRSVYSKDNISVIRIEITFQ
ncbi:MAG: hypothetical protein ACE5J4_01805 [Candidatus Aenigmatarchaeota archaeon]